MTQMITFLKPILNVVGIDGRPIIYSPLLFTGKSTWHRGFAGQSGRGTSATRKNTIKIVSEE